jgi:hypothetical protein
MIQYLTSGSRRLIVRLQTVAPHYREKPSPSPSTRNLQTQTWDSVTRGGKDTVLFPNSSLTNALSLSFLTGSLCRSHRPRLIAQFANILHALGGSGTVSCACATSSIAVPSAHKMTSSVSTFARGEPRDGARRLPACAHADGPRGGDGGLH